MMLLTRNLETAFRPGGACSDALTGPTAAAADTAANTAPSVTDGSPSPAEITTRRERVDHHGVRVRLGEDVYDVHGAGLDSRGVAFAPGDLRGVPAMTPGALLGAGVGAFVHHSKPVWHGSASAPEAAR